MPAEGGAQSLAKRAVTSPVTAALLVLLIYAGLALLNSTGGYLGTDTGAKVITLEEMVDGSTTRPDVGYWAEEWDESGDLHPLYQTMYTDRGEWVNVTTLPMLIASMPLYEAGGYRLSLLFPMLGAVLAAFACRDLARQLADDAAGWLAFWVVAAASPIAIYALDFWEHSVGAGLMLSAIALLLRFFRRAAGWWAPLAAGLALGTSATMRSETFVVAFVTVAVVGAGLVLRRDVARSVGTGALAVVGFVGPWLGNRSLESGLGGNSRTSRATGIARTEWWSELGVRTKEALITWFGLPNLGYPGSVMFGMILVVAVVWSVRTARAGDQPRAAIMLLLAAAVLFVSLVGGLGFVSGALVASPIAACAVLVRSWDTERVLLVAIAAGATVITWMFQYTGGAGPQWGGRYILVPTLVLTTLGVVALRDAPERERIGVIGLAVAVTAFGAVWLHQRSDDVDRFFEALSDRPEDVIVSTNPFLVREAGPAYEEKRYLSIGRGVDVTDAVDVVEDAGFSTFGVVAFTEELRPSVDAEHVGTDRMDFLGVPAYYHRFRLG